MAEISFRTLVWLTYKLGATFAFGLPLILLIWASIKKEYSIVRLLSIYWKVASLIPISILLLTGDRSIGHLTSFAAPFLLVTSIWFWVDLNEELRDLPHWKPLNFIVKVWRWIISFFGVIYLSLSFSSLSCIQSLSNQSCNAWKEAPIKSHIMLKGLFNFLFGANWTESLAAFLGYLALIAYLVGLLQWLLVRFPKQGRIAGGF
ncbi:DUF3177 family protein [Prochlorococcus marinus]|uniref:DUF3177 domain-containing protein n=1 Tax=Prochlorococcus marinus (strain MIT 9211) TaxID=93059 RepID=A9BDK8_PROM4|nr:DUF3177 family protein [Prochlorococcus marinus]ABX08194.1 conserved hypothetical protein [Prochlorococcus marinus str. MIT 9211]